MDTPTPDCRPSMRKLARRRLDTTTQAFREAGLPFRCLRQGSWIGAIRDALGMTVQDLADRLGLTRASVAKIEANEVRRTLQLDTLQKVANALGCDLVYALVPRDSLERTVQARRMEIARTLVKDATFQQAQWLVRDSMLWRPQVAPEPDAPQAAVLTDPTSASPERSL